MIDFSQVRVLIPTGFGLNCESESAQAWKTLGASARVLHWNELFRDPALLDEAHLLMLIGGFAYGDHVASGRVLATRLRRRMGPAIERFILANKLILGVCNGFQTMVKLGLLPGLNGEWDRQRVSLIVNEPPKFRDAWVRLAVDKESPCIFTRGLQSLELPVRH